MGLFFRKRDIDPPKPTLKQRFRALVINTFMLCLAIIAVYVLVVFIQTPSLDSILKETRLPVVTILDNGGSEIRSSNKIMGTPVSVDSLPPHVWQAIIAIEDKRFFNHGAIDARGMARAVLSNMLRGRFAVGGSSITQQTAKNIFLSRKKKISRKIQELILSYWLENRFDKNQILDLYMNRVSLVGGLRGIDAASRMLFGEPATKLSIAQSAQISAMLKAPTTYSPLRHPDRNIARARVILKEMVRQKYITLAQAQTAAKQLGPAKKMGDNNRYRYWADFVFDEVRSRIGQVNDDIKVYTTLDRKLQNKISSVVSSKVNGFQAAAIAMARDGAVRAMVGGDNYQESQFNRTLAKRQPGSAFKPVVYLVALENGMRADSFVNDSPFSIGDYNPKNYADKYYGDISLSGAFSKSVNSVPLKLTQDYGIDTILNMAGRLGIGSKLRREYSTVLGASEMTLLDLTNMYDVIWNDGAAVHNYSINKIITLDGRVLYQRNPSDGFQVVKVSTAKLMQDLMAQVVKSGTGRRANTSGVLGGKTGTSNENRDAWFIGATRDLTIGIWTGHDNYTPMNKKITGGSIPAEIFHDIVK